MKITLFNNRGIHLTRNNTTFSIMFGAGNYCENYDKDTLKTFSDINHITSSHTCEVAVWEADPSNPKQSNWITYKVFLKHGEHIEGNCDVVGHISISEALITALTYFENMGEH